MSVIYVLDIVLLVILYLLIIFMCGYSAFCVYKLLRSTQMRILLRPTRVVFSHRKEGESTEELRTVVAYQNPFTGDYCVHKSRAAGGYLNALPTVPDTDQYHDHNYDHDGLPLVASNQGRDHPDGSLFVPSNRDRDHSNYQSYGQDDGSPFVASNRDHNGFRDPDGSLFVASNRDHGRDQDGSPFVASPDSGLSDAYEPLRMVPQEPAPKVHSILKPSKCDNSVNKSWNWNYKEYQI